MHTCGFAGEEHWIHRPPDAFELCNGSIEKREMTDAKKVKVKAHGVEEEYEYACVRIQAVVSNIWNVSRYTAINVWLIS
jgi:hypothetical protein